ncbi:MAG TPA: hypothetical protein VLF59_02860 [Candidatus Saccharimonadales bacterium]|nr:hypothetical protein [Candidatus Saccharimonadales bacterium]
MQRKLLLSGVVLLALTFLVLAGVSVLHHPAAVAITHQQKLPSQYTSASRYSEKAILFAEGGSFKLYDFAGGGRKTISSFAGNANALDTIDSVSVSSDHRYILFHNSTNADGSVFANITTAKGLDMTSDYWWIYNTMTQSYTPLPSGTRLAKLHGGRVYTLTSNSDGDRINSYSPDTVQQQSSVSIVPSVNFLVTDRGYILEALDGNMYQTRDGVTNSQLLSHLKLVASTDDGKQIIVTQLVQDTTNLLIIDSGTATVTVIAQNIGGWPAWNNSGLIMYATKGLTTGYNIYNLTTQKTTGWKLAKNIPYSSDPVALLSPNTALLSTTSENYYLISSTTISAPQ